MKRECKTCEWFSEDTVFKGTFVVSEGTVDEYASECRKKSPPWPETGPDKWCGEYQRKDEANETD
jgi:hypothetical protein